MKTLALAAALVLPTAASAATISRAQFDQQYASYGTQIEQVRTQYNAGVSSCKKIQDYNQEKSCEDQKYAAFNSQTQSINARQNDFYNAWSCDGTSCVSKGGNPPMPEQAKKTPAKAAPSAMPKKKITPKDPAAMDADCDKMKGGPPQISAGEIKVASKPSRVVPLYKEAMDQLEGRNEYGYNGILIAETVGGTQAAMNFYVFRHNRKEFTQVCQKALGVVAVPQSALNGTPTQIGAAVEDDIITAVGRYTKQEFRKKDPNENGADLEPKK